MHFCIAALLLFAASVQAYGAAPQLHLLAKEFFAWRVVEQPASSDDVNRVQRPDGWIPNWSPEGLAGYNATQKQFMRKLAALDQHGWTVADSIDF
ncbi:MAG: hypothetical protein ABI623_09655, partial [bacterium]